MATVFAKRKLSDCRDVAYEIVRTHPTLAAPCFDLVALFRELKAYEPEASGLYDTLRRLKSVTNPAQLVSRKFADALESSLHEIVRELHTFLRTYWTLSDRIFIALRINKFDERRDALHHVLKMLEEAVDIYEGRVDEYLLRKANAQARAFEEPLLSVLDGRLPPSTLSGLVF